MSLRSLVLASLSVSLILCAVGCSGSSQTASGRDSAADPLVRERVMTRMNELYAPAKKDAQKVHELTARRECGGICEMATGICDASGRICELAADYPQSDDEVQETCVWATADCNEARGSCAGCGGEDPAGASE